MESFTLNAKWQQYFYNMARTAATASPCLSRKVGAVLITPEKQIISTGYNGPPRGVVHCNDGRVAVDPILIGRDLEYEVDTCPRRRMGFASGKGLEFCPAAHAERNALIQAARHGIATNNSILCVTCEIPCKDCLIELINAGVKTVYVTSMTSYDALSDFLINESGLQVIQYAHIGATHGSY